MLPTEFGASRRTDCAVSWSRRTGLRAVRFRPFARWWCCTDIRLCFSSGSARSSRQRLACGLGEEL